MQRDSILGTFVVATVLCVVCSLMVSGTAQRLKARITNNERLDRKKNILLAAQLADESAKPGEINEVYEERIKERWIDLSTGEEVPPSQLPTGYDPAKAANDPKLRVPVESGALMGVRYREPYAAVYEIYDGDKVSGYVLPVYGKGLWGTIWGFLALQADAQTVKGITFYKHKETPGLGAEIESEAFKSQWPGKTARDDQGDVLIQVKKGQTPEGTPAAEYTIDGLTGATITTRGVDHLARYWLGEQGFGQFLAKQ